MLSLVVTVVAMNVKLAELGFVDGRFEDFKLIKKMASCMYLISDYIIHIIYIYIIILCIPMMRQVISQVACQQSTIFVTKAVPFRVANMPIKPCTLAVFVSLQTALERCTSVCWESYIRLRSRSRTDSTITSWPPLLIATCCSTKEWHEFTFCEEEFLVRWIGILYDVCQVKSQEPSIHDSVLCLERPVPSIANDNR